jgi:hypothetical protein
MKYWTTLGWLIDRVCWTAFASVTLLLLCRIQAAEVQTNATPAKPKIGIMKFEVDGDLKPSLGQFLQAALMEHLLASKRYTVVDWDEIDRILAFLNKSQPHLSPDEARQQAVHQLGLEKIGTGSLAKLGGRWFVTVKIMSLDLSIERIEKLSVPSEDALEGGLGTLAALLLKTPEEARAERPRLEKMLLEATDWDRVKAKPSQENLTAYLESYPDGSHAAEAKKLLAQIKDEAAAGQAGKGQNLAGSADVRRIPANTNSVAEGNRNTQGPRQEQNTPANLAGRWRCVAPNSKATFAVEIVQEGSQITMKWLKSGMRTGGTYRGTFQNGKIEASGSWSGLVACGYSGVLLEDGNTIQGYHSGGNGYSLNLLRQPDQPNKRE